MGRSIDELQGQVSNLRQQTVETNTQVKQIQQAITVAPPAVANAAPKTIGEHVSVLESQLGDVRKNLSDNLGVHIHGLMDATYDYNFNRPNTTPILNEHPFYSNDPLIAQAGGGFLPSHTYTGQDTLLAAAVYSF